MTPAFFIDLARQSLFSPRAAASRLLALDLPAAWLWMALALMTVLNAITYSVSLYITGPAPAEAAQVLPPMLGSPMLFALFLGGGLALTVLAVTWIGQKMGGKARLADILAVIAWLQVLRLAVQLGALVLMLALPGLVGLVLIAASVWGLVILVAFLDRAHGFENWPKTVLMLLVASLAMVVVLTLVLGLTGVSVMEGT